MQSVYCNKFCGLKQTESTGYLITKQQIKNYVEIHSKTDQHVLRKSVLYSRRILSGYQQ